MSIHVLVDELTRSLERARPERRGELLRGVTDLYVTQCDGLSDAHVAIFDDVLSALAKGAGHETRADLARRIAGLTRAPPRLARDLAFDESIEIAGPVIERAAGLDDADLVRIVETMGPSHRLALALRPDPPPALKAALAAKRPASPDASPAPSEAGVPREADLVGLLAEGRRADVLAALARMSRLPPESVGRSFRSPENDPLIILCKSLDLAWPTFRALLDLKTGRPLTQKSIESAQAAFEQLAVATAQRVLRFVTAREKLSA